MTKKEAWISIDSQLPNALAHEAISNDVIEEQAVLLFVVQVEYATGFSPNKVTDPDFALMVESQII